MTFRFAYLLHLFIPAVIFSVFSFSLLLPRKKTYITLFLHFVMFWILQIINIYFIDNNYMNLLVFIIGSFYICYFLYLDSSRKRYQVVFAFVVIQLCAYIFTEIPLSFLYSIRLQVYEIFDREFTIYAASLYDMWLLGLSYYYVMQVCTQKNSEIFFKYMSLPICQLIFAYVIFLLCYDLAIVYVILIMVVVCMILIIMNILMLKSYKQLNINFMNRFETIRIAEMLMQEKELYDLKERLYNEVTSIEVLLKNQLFMEANDYLKDKYKELKQINIGRFCEHKMVDMVLHHKTSLMKEKDIDYRVEDYVREDIGIEDVDLVTLLFNILDNAIEGCEKIEGQKYIYIKIYEKYRCCYLEVINSKDPNVDHSDLKTTKEDTMNHGIGISIIKNIVKKYDGDVLFEDNKETFRVKLFLKIDS